MRIKKNLEYIYRFIIQIMVDIFIVTPSNLSMQRNIEYPRALLGRSITQDIRTTQSVTFKDTLDLNKNIRLLHKLIALNYTTLNTKTST